MLEVIHPERRNILQQLQKRTLKNFMDILILSELRKAPMSGYDVITSIFDKFNYLPSSGSVYSLLYALEREDLVKGGWNGRKRIYSITSRGIEIVETTQAMYPNIEGIVKCIFNNVFSFS
ncbi:MAG: PadR family transcriptional regulator [Candidatus Bathyarchaeia archaeon]